MKWPSQSGRGTRVQIQVSSSLPLAVPMSHWTPWRQWGWEMKNGSVTPAPWSWSPTDSVACTCPQWAANLGKPFTQLELVFILLYGCCPFFQMQSVSHSVAYDSLQPHGLQPTSLLCPWNSPGKNSGLGFPSPSPGLDAMPFPNKELQKSEFTLCVYPGVSC